LPRIKRIFCFDFNRNVRKVLGKVDNGFLLRISRIKRIFCSVLAYPRSWCCSRYYSKIISLCG
jgi:hypothetical protein